MSTLSFLCSIEIQPEFYGCSYLLYKKFWKRKCSANTRDILLLEKKKYDTEWEGRKKKKNKEQLRYIMLTEPFWNLFILYIRCLCNYYFLKTEINLNLGNLKNNYRVCVKNSYFDWARISNSLLLNSFSVLYFTQFCSHFSFWYLGFFYSLSDCYLIWVQCFFLLFLCFAGIFAIDSYFISLYSEL